ncbi:MAG: Ig-like domain-containing protein, partial [Dolichospermum sp.]
TSNGGPTSSGFGTGGNMDALYVKNDATYLYGGIAGSLQNGSNNRILLFIDSKSGGYNSLSSWTNRNNSPYYSLQNLNGGTTFDGGFSPDYVLCVNQASGVGYFDLYDMQANSNTFLGNSGTSILYKYQGNSGTGDYTKGFEFAIPLNLIGNPSGSVQFFAMLVNDPGCCAATTLSNQFLTRCNNGENNYGNGIVTFGSASPNPISYTLSTLNCYSENCLTVAAKPTIAAITGNNSVCIGNTTQLANTTASGVWSSSNNSVATINASGAITGISAGSSIIKYIVTNGSGCKDSVSIAITVKASSTSTTNVTICPSQLPYLWNGINRTIAGTYTFTTTNSQGCDSLATLNLTVKANSTSTNNISICPSQLPYSWNGLNFTGAGTQTKTGLINSQGCDSSATLNLTVKT